MLVGLCLNSEPVACPCTVGYVGDVVHKKPHTTEWRIGESINPQKAKHANRDDIVLPLRDTTPPTVSVAVDDVDRDRAVGCKWRF